MTHPSHFLSPRCFRPTLEGFQRDERYPPTKWRCVEGLVHFANETSNQTHCELWIDAPQLLELTLDKAMPLDTPVTCVACLGWALPWPA